MSLYFTHLKIQKWLLTKTQRQKKCSWTLFNLDLKYRFTKYWIYEKNNSFKNINNLIIWFIKNKNLHIYSLFYLNVLFASNINKYSSLINKHTSLHCTLQYFQLWLISIFKKTHLQHCACNMSVDGRFAKRKKYWLACQI